MTQKTITTLHDKRRFAFIPERDGWIPHQYEETKQYDSFYGWNPNWIVVDAGAWLGIWTMWASQYVRKVYAVEPVKELHRLLLINAALNNAENVDVSRFAFWSVNKPLEITVTKYPAGSTLTDTWRFGAEHVYNGAFKEQVPGLTWDCWTENTNINKVNLLKIDVEGAELHVLEAMMRNLPERIIAAIYHKTAPFAKIFNVLTDKKYVLDGFGYYDSRALNKGKPHSAFFRRKDIPFQTPIRYEMGSYELPTRKAMDRGIPFYWENMGVRK